MDYGIINFTYKCPNQDMDKCCGYNPDGSVNIKYTFTALRNLFLKNAEIMSRLIEKSDHITNIDIVDFNCIQLELDCHDAVTTLFEDNILSRPEDDVNSDDDTDEELEFSDTDTETNQDRYKMINNMVNQNSLQILSDESESDSDDDDDNDIVDNRNNVKNVLKKYGGMIKNYKIDDSDSD